MIPFLTARPNLHQKCFLPDGPRDLNPKPGLNPKPSQICLEVTKAAQQVFLFIYEKNDGSWEEALCCLSTVEGGSHENAWVFPQNRGTLSLCGPLERGFFSSWGIKKKGVPSISGSTHMARRSQDIPQATRDEVSAWRKGSGFRV